MKIIDAVKVYEDSYHPNVDAAMVHEKEICLKASAEPDTLILGVGDYYILERLNPGDFSFLFYLAGTRETAIGLDLRDGEKEEKVQDERYSNINPGLLKEPIPIESSTESLEGNKVEGCLSSLSPATIAELAARDFTL